LIEEGKRSDVIFWKNVSPMGQEFSSHPELFTDDVIRDESPEFDLNIDEPIEVAVTDDIKLPRSELNIEAEPNGTESTEFEFDIESTVEDKVSIEPEKAEFESFEFTPSTAAIDKAEDIASIDGKEDASESLEMIDFSIDKTDKNEVESTNTSELEELEVFDWS
jgi:hypothetical protein